MNPFFYEHIAYSRKSLYVSSDLVTVVNYLLVRENMQNVCHFSSLVISFETLGVFDFIRYFSILMGSISKKFYSI